MPQAPYTVASLRAPIARRFVIEWLAVSCFGLVVILLAVFAGLTASADRVVFDEMLRFNAHPVSQDIVIVAIDDTSVARLGRWPWQRQVHAQLLEKIAAGRPSAVVYDVLFTEPADGDDALARAMTLSPTFLPILLPKDIDGHAAAIVPVEPLVRSAAGLGHINLEVDSDGVLRSVALFENDRASRWPQLSIPVLRDIRDGKIALADRQRPSSGFYARASSTSNREGRFLVPFSPLSDAYRKISFADLLDGRVPVDELKGKIVLIGVTASGLAAPFSTPVSGELGPLPGIDIHANVLDALLNGREIAPAPRSLVLALSCLPLVLLFCGLLMLSPLRLLVLTAVLCAGVSLSSFALLATVRLWVSPMPAIASILIVFAIWNWRRLEMTMTYLRDGLQGLVDEPYVLPERPPRAREFRGDVLQQHMALMAQASQRVQDMRRFVSSSLESVPGPILVSDARGVIVIANHAAKQHFERLGAGAPVGQSMRDALGNLQFVKSVEFDTDTNAWIRADWPAVLDPRRLEFADLMESGIEVRDSDARDHLLRFARFTNAQGEPTGWIASLVDVTALHVAQQHREDAMHLLSHEMRLPQASILALIQIERARPIDSPRMREFLSHVERYAQRTLTLADDFVQLSRAEWQAYSLEAVSLTEILLDACDEVWPQAQAKKIRLDTHYDGGDGYWINADRALLTRALVNVLNNAVKYSPSGTAITCTIGDETVQSGRTPGFVQCTVCDQGYGIPADQQRFLFERFRRFHEAERPEIRGAGLGMAFVRAVVIRHTGEIYVSSTPGEGTAITILLPSLDEVAG
jgi:CHASE2 domain-containing sensor protein/signal transduction histidine kinase